MIMLNRDREEANRVWSLLDYDDHEIEYVINRDEGGLFSTVTRYNWVKDKGSEVEWRFYDRTTDEIVEQMIEDGVVGVSEGEMYVFKSEVEGCMNEWCSSYVEYGRL